MPTVPLLAHVFVSLDGPAPARDRHSFPTRRSSDLQSQECRRKRTHQVGRVLVEIGSEGQMKVRSEEHTSELQSPYDIVCRLLLEKKMREANDRGFECLILEYCTGASDRGNDLEALR